MSLSAIEQGHIIFIHTVSIFKLILLDRVEFAITLNSENRHYIVSYFSRLYLLSVGRSSLD